MAALKDHLMKILFGLAVAGSLGMAGWAYMAGDGVHKQLQAVDALRGKVRSQANGAANLESIRKRGELSELRNKAVDDTLTAALRPQKFNVFEGRQRALLIPEILPEPKSDAARIDFKRKYNEAFADLNKRLRARDKPSAKEKQLAEELMLNRETGTRGDGEIMPWRPAATLVARAPDTQQPGKKVERSDALKANSGSRIAEKIAKGIHTYVDNLALGPHIAGAAKTTLKPETIWHAHMTLWIAQDFVAALGALNEQRVRELEAAGRGYDAWVAHMPVKRIKMLNIDDKLGRQGGINTGGKDQFPASFTRDKNERQHFMVPIAITLVVEEAAVMRVLDAICAAGYYTPVRVQYTTVAPNAAQEDYLYGDDPVVEIKVDLEAYFFRVVYEDWIPKVLKKILETPDAYEKPTKGRG